jgi:hypothetical protein
VSEPTKRRLCSPFVERLNKLFPGENWRAHRTGFRWEYTNDKDAYAGWCSCLAPQYDGDDESAVSRFFIYRDNAATKELYQLELQKLTP